MQSNRFVGLHKLIHLLLMLAIMISLFPAQPVAADDLQIRIPKDKVSEALWLSIWRDRGANVYYTEIANQLFNAYELEIGNSKAARAIMDRVYTAFKSQKTAWVQKGVRLRFDQVVRHVFDISNKEPGLLGVNKTVWQKLGDPNFYGTNGYGAPEDLRTAILYDTERDFRNRLDKIGLAVHKRAREDTEFARNFDIRNKGLIEYPLSQFNAFEYLQKNPSPFHQVLLDNMNADGSIELSANELKDFARLEFGKINTSISDMRQTLDSINKQQQDLVDFMKDEQKRRAAEELAATKAAQNELELRAANAHITTISTLAGFIDPKLGKHIEVLSVSLLKVGETLSGWMQATAGLSTLDKLTSLSTVVATGNIIGAVMNVMNMFGDQNSPDQMILQEIGKLRQQVKQLGLEMHDRFDRVDQELNTIYTAMQDRFDKIDLQLGRINGNLSEIQRTLVSLDMQLSRMERNNYEFLDALGRRDLLNAINGGIQYKARTGLNMLYQPDYVNYENVFQSWGTVTAFDALSAGPMQRDYRDSQVLSELTALPLDANLNYLNGWLSTHGIQPFSSKRLPGPRDWRFATRSYAQLGLEWPEHLRRIDPSRPQALDSVGEELDQAIQRISTLDTAQGPVGNTILFTNVISYYHTKLDGLNTTLINTETAYLNDVYINRLQRQVAFDLFAGPTQNLDYKVPGTTTACDGSSATELAIAPVMLTDIAKVYTLADYLKLDTVSACLFARLENARPICKPQQPDVCDFLGDLRLDSIVSYANKQIAIRTWLGPRVVLVGETSPTEYAVQHWGNLRNGFQANSARVAPTPAQAQERSKLLADTTAAVEQELLRYQKELLTQIFNGLGGQGTGRLRDSVKELSGAKKLLDSFVTLGLATALENDDFLRALLSGKQSILDEQLTLEAYINGLAALQGANAKPGTNPRITMLAQANKRHTALRALIMRYLDAITANRFSSENRLILDARLDLELARKLASSSSAGGSVTLPLVMR